MTNKSSLLVLLALLLLAVAKSEDLLNKNTFDNFIKARCIENAENNATGLEAYDVIKDADKTFVACMEHNINQTEITMDFFDAYFMNNFTSFFHNYCKKRPVVLTCVDTFFKKTAVCYDKDLQEIQEMVRKIIVAFMNFLCEDDGEAYMRFLTKDSMECVRSKQFNTQMDECVEKNFDEYFPKDEQGERHITRIVLGEKQCKSIWNYENCVIDVLDKCEGKTALEVFQLLLRHIKKEAQYCKKYEVQDNLIEHDDKN